MPRTLQRGGGETLSGGIDAWRVARRVYAGQPADERGVLASGYRGRMSSPSSELTIPSALESFEALTIELSDALDALLARSKVVYVDAHPSFITWNPHRWAPLERADQRLVKDAAVLVNRWQQLGCLAVVAGDERRLKSFESPNRVIERVIDRSGASPAPATTVEGGTRGAHHGSAETTRRSSGTPDRPRRRRALVGARYGDVPAAP